MEDAVAPVVEESGAVEFESERFEPNTMESKTQVWFSMNVISNECSLSTRLSEAKIGMAPTLEMFALLNTTGGPLSRL